MPALLTQVRVRTFAVPVSHHEGSPGRPLGPKARNHRRCRKHPKRLALAGGCGEVSRQPSTWTCRGTLPCHWRSEPVALLAARSDFLYSVSPRSHTALPADSGFCSFAYLTARRHPNLRATHITISWQPSERSHKLRVRVRVRLVQACSLKLPVCGLPNGRPI